MKFYKMYSNWNILIFNSFHKLALIFVSRKTDNEEFLTLWCKVHLSFPLLSQYVILRNMILLRNHVCRWERLFLILCHIISHSNKGIYIHCQTLFFFNLYIFVLTTNNAIFRCRVLARGMSSLCRTFQPVILQTFSKYLTKFI